MCLHFFLVYYHDTVIVYSDRKHILNLKQLKYIYYIKLMFSQKNKCMVMLYYNDVKVEISYNIV